ncbi:MAG: MBL fold metallo-hydrolase [Chloroflexi bacterium]|nr:MBL fold metallo-hydrolase [Chloroflexota bacterium]
MSTAGTLEPIRIRLGANNVYILRGPGGAVCIDAGPDYEGAWDTLVENLRSHDLLPHNVSVVVLTHGHLDHSGLAVRWQQAGTIVAAGVADIPDLANAADTRAAQRERVLATLIEHGVPKEWLRRPATSGGGDGRGWRAERSERWPGPLRTTPVQVDMALADGDHVLTSGLNLRVVAWPGHTPGTTGVVWRSDGVEQLFTGDHLLPHQVATVGIQFDGGVRWPSMPAYVRSLGKLETYRDVRAWPGHGEMIGRTGDAFDWSRRYLERRAARLRRQLSQGPGTAFELALRTLPHLDRDHIWPVMSETIGLLDLLEERGEVEPSRRDGLITYVATNGAIREEPANDGGV